MRLRLILDVRNVHGGLWMRKLRSTCGFLITAASIASACVIAKFVSPRLPRRAGQGKAGRTPDRGGEQGRDPHGRDGQCRGCLQGTGSRSPGSTGPQPASKREAVWGHKKQTPGTGAPRSRRSRARAERSGATSSRAAGSKARGAGHAWPRTSGLGVVTNETFDASPLDKTDCGRVP